MPLAHWPLEEVHRKNTTLQDLKVYHGLQVYHGFIVC